MRDEKIKQFLKEYVAGEITPEELFDSNLLSTPEKLYINDEMLKDAGRPENWGIDDTFETRDPINKFDGPIFTWGTEKADEKFTPIEPHTLCVLAGDKGSGKTAYSFDFAIKNAENARVLYLSLEMTGAQIVRRIAINFAGITKAEWRVKKNIPERKREAYFRKKKEIQDIRNLTTAGKIDGEHPTIKNIQKIILENEPEIVIIDNLDIIQTGETDDIKRQASIVRDLMWFTNEHNIPIILIHHLSKGGDKSSMNSIRGSGKITDDADQVLMCYRKMEEEMTREEAARFVMCEKKDRLFGVGGVHTFFFDKGTFVDQFEDYTGFS